MLDPITYSLIYQAGLAEYVIALNYSKLPNTFKLLYETTTSNRRIIVEETSEKLLVNTKHRPCRYTILNPVLREIPYQLIRTIKPYTLIIAADLQGFIRTYDSDGVIKYIDVEDIEYMIRYLDIIHTSIDELKKSYKTLEEEKILKITSSISKRNRSFIIITRGVKTPIVIERGRIYEVEERYMDRCRKGYDTTGAGDYFLGILFVKYIEIWDIIESTIEAYLETCRWVSRRSLIAVHHPEPPPPSRPP